MIWDHYEYTIASHFLSALINDDPSGLEGDEDRQLTEFERAAHANAKESGFTVGHWDYDSDELDNGNFTYCDVTGLRADCVTLRLMVYKAEVHA
jgi:hypothetical protein